LRTLIGAVVTSLGACVDAAAFTAFYRRRRRALGGEPVLTVVEEEKTPRLVLPAGRRASPWRWCWGSSLRRE